MASTSRPWTFSGRWELQLRSKSVVMGQVKSKLWESESSLYARWEGMIQRCTDHNARAWARYGGRGIKVCQKWRRSFAAFRDWAECNGYSPELTLDRRDNDKGYSPTNCRWVTYQANANNRSTCRRLTAFGKTKTISDWSRDPRCRVDYRTLLYRVRKAPKLWQALAAIITPARPKKPNHCH